MGLIWSSVCFLAVLSVTASAGIKAKTVAADYRDDVCLTRISSFHYINWILAGVMFLPICRSTFKHRLHHEREYGKLHIQPRWPFSHVQFFVSIFPLIYIYLQTSIEILIDTLITMFPWDFSSWWKVWYCARIVMLELEKISNGSFQQIMLSIKSQNYF